MGRSRCQGGSAKPAREERGGVCRRTQPDILFEFRLNAHRYTCPREPRGTGDKEKGPTVEGGAESSWPGASRQPDTYLAAFPTPPATQKSRSRSARAQGCSIVAGSSFFHASCCTTSGGRGTPGTPGPPPLLPWAAPGLGSSRGSVLAGGKGMLGTWGGGVCRLGDARVAPVMGTVAPLLVRKGGRGRLCTSGREPPPAPPLFLSSLSKTLLPYFLCFHTLRDFLPRWQITGG